MRRIVMVGALVLAACSSSSSDPTPIFGGFTPQDAGAVVLPPAVCNIAGLGSTAISGIAITFTDYVGACDVLAQTQLCGSRASSTNVLGVVLTGVPGGTTVAPAGPGTYRFMTTAPTGPFLAATGDAAVVGATCDPVDGSALPNVNGGSITITSVSAEQVSGEMALRFEGGQEFAQPFTSVVCPMTVDPCALLETGCWNYVCAPAP